MGADVAAAAAALAAGRLVAFPTETVYGLGVRADDEAAVRALFRAKGRPRDKGLIVHVTRIEAARAATAAWPQAAQRLAEAFWPGPLTLVLPRASTIPSVVAGGGDTIAVRAPDHPVALALLAACDFPVAAPSANMSGDPPPTEADQISSALRHQIAVVLDGGRCPLKTPSTIVDLTGDAAQILREGSITPQQIADALAD